MIGEPERPAGLSAKAWAVWDKVVPIIAPGVLAKDNGQTLARYCSDLVRWWKLAAWLEGNDEICRAVDQNGNVKFTRHPNVITYEKLGASLLRMEQEFGLTPSSRTRIGTSGNGDEAKKPEGKTRFFPGGPAMRIAHA